MCSAGPREQAKRIHDRLTGTPPDAAVLDSMATKVAAGNALGAAQDAMANPAFYNTTVRELATPWTNRDRSVYADLNDSTATVIGMVRDDVSFDQLLSRRHRVRRLDGRDAGARTRRRTTTITSSCSATASTSRNTANLVRQTQSSLPGTPLGATQTAGIMTTRGFAERVPRRRNESGRRAVRGAELCCAWTWRISAT